MPDFGSPVAQTIAGPQQGLQTLSGLLNLERTQQAITSQNLGIQQQQQALQVGQSNVQQATQQMNERELLQKTMLSGKDPDGNPIKDPNGEINPVAVSAFANKYLPLTGQAVTQNIVQTLDNRVKLNDSIRSLNQGYRNDISGIVRSAIGTSETPEQINRALDAYAQKNPESVSSIANAMSLINNLGGSMTQAQRDNALQHLAMEFQPASTTEAQQQPVVSPYTTGSGNIGTMQTNPYAPGGMGQIGPTYQQGINPADRTQVGINPLTGQPYAVIKSSTGVGAGIGGVGGAGGGAGGGIAVPANAPGVPSYTPSAGWPKLPAFPTPQEVQSATSAASEADAIRNADSNPVTGYAPTRQVYSNLLNLVSQDPNIGPGSKEWNKFIGEFGTLGGFSPNANMQEVSSYLDRLALQNAGSAGLSTDAARQMAAVSTGTTEMNPQALAEKLRFGQATLEASHAYREGLDKVVGTSNQNPIAKRAYDSAWAQNADINAFRLLAAKNDDDKVGYQMALKQIQSMSPSQRAQIQEHMRNLNMLIEGEMPK